MAKFDYVRASTVEEAVALLEDPSHRSRPLAGGTDLLVLLRHQKPPFDRVVDLTRVPEMKLIERRGDEIYRRRGGHLHRGGREPPAPGVRAVPGRGGADGRRAGNPQHRHARRQHDQRGRVRRRRAVARLPRCSGAPGQPGRQPLAARQRPGDRREPDGRPARRAADPFHRSRCRPRARGRPSPSSAGATRRPSPG